MPSASHLRRALGRRARRLYDVLTDAPSELDRLKAEGVVSIGEHTYGTPAVPMWRYPDGSAKGGKLAIGRYCSIAHDVTIFTGGEHNTRRVTST